jgi:hypothetical protein
VVFVRANKDTESGKLPTREELEAMGRFNEELARDGVLLAADGLRPSSKGTRIRFDAGRATVVDGPFAETKELVAGFWIVQGKTHQEVVERFTRAPFDPGFTLEIRECYEPEDFGDAFTPEMREREAGLQGGSK